MKKIPLAIFVSVLVLSAFLPSYGANLTYPSPSNVDMLIDEKPTTWYSPEGVLPKNFKETTEVYGSSQIELKYKTIDSSESRIYLLVTSSIYNHTLSSLNQYVADMESLGFSISVYSGSWGTPEDVRTFLQQGLLNGLNGCLLIGDIPVAWYEMDNPSPWGHEEFPIDLYYMDLNGNWTDIDGDGIYDGHSGDVSPEIWVGRLKASNLDGDEGLLLKNYFTKNHYYRAGMFTLPQRALVYVDDDWYPWADSDNDALKQVYNETTLVKDSVTTNAEDYKNRLIQGYEWIHLRCHGSASSHTFKIPEDQWDGTVYSSDYRSISPDAFFYQLFVCSAARYTENNYLGGSCIFTDTSGLLVIGSTKTGSMLYFNDFYSSLAEGSAIGDAFKEWFIRHGESDPKWFYGLTILGDPLLKPLQPSNRPLIDLALVSISHYSIYTTDDFDFLDYSYDIYDENNITLLFSGTPKRVYSYDAVVVGLYAATSTDYPVEAGIVMDSLTENAVAMKTYVENGGGLAVFAQHNYSWLPIEFQSYTSLGHRTGGEINKYCLTQRIVKKPNDLTFYTGSKIKPTNDDLYAHHFSVWEGESVGTQHGIYTSIARDDWTLLSDVTTWIVGLYGKGKISLTTMLLDYYCGHNDTKYSAFYRCRLAIENTMYWLTQPIRVRLDYPTIQEAINAANPRDTIFVYNGTYYEHVVVNKTVSLIGENRSNTIIDGNNTGTVIEVTASNTNITDFTIQNGWWGVYLYMANNDTVSGNNIINNLLLGIYVQSSSNNAIYHNNFIANAVDGGYGNVWDDGYPSGGNYWSDYTGNDTYGGPYQNETGSDGIGDTPYTIDANNNRDRYPFMNPWPPHDIAIVNVTPSKTLVGQGYSVAINVTVENQGDTTETFNLTTYANTTIIATVTNVTLTSGNSTIIIFTWNTTGFAKGIYNISAVTDTVPGETDLADNTYTDGTVRVAMVGDVTEAFGVVDIFDIVYVAVSFGTSIGDPRYNPNADLTCDGIIDIFDIVTIAIHFGEKDCQ